MEGGTNRGRAPIHHRLMSVAEWLGKTVLGIPKVGGVLEKECTSWRLKLNGADADLGERFPALMQRAESTILQGLATT